MTPGFPAHGPGQQGMVKRPRKLSQAKQRCPSRHLVNRGRGFGPGKGVNARLCERQCQKCARRQRLGAKPSREEGAAADSKEQGPLDRPGPVGKRRAATGRGQGSPPCGIAHPAGWTDCRAVAAWHMGAGAGAGGTWVERHLRPHSAWAARGASGPPCWLPLPGLVREKCSGGRRQGNTAAVCTLCATVKSLLWRMLSRVVGARGRQLLAWPSSHRGLISMAQWARKRGGAASLRRA
jgi:hypothetical protein